jgi:thiaminase/transcriptional activator TenA
MGALMPERFSDHLRGLADSIWRAQLEHPFVQAISDGSLDRARFRHWIKQDYRFLIDYCRLFGLAAARSPDLETLVQFADLLQATARTEMELHRGLAADFGISAAELEGTAAASRTQAYTDFLLRTAATEDFAQLVAALLPCMWSFSEIGLALARRERPADLHLAAWIDTYASSEFTALSDWFRNLVDRLGEEASEHGRAAMERAFLASSRHELAFWDMAWALEQ